MVVAALKDYLKVKGVLRPLIILPYWEITEKLSKILQPHWIAWFWKVFWLFLSWLTLCDMCGNFDYHKPIFYEFFYVYRKMQKCACSSNILEFFLHDPFSPVWATYLIWVATQNMNFCVLQPTLNCIRSKDTL